MSVFSGAANIPSNDKVSADTAGLANDNFYGGGSCIKDCFRLFRAPSTNTPLSFKKLSRLFQRGCLDRTLAFPHITMPYLARVNATLSRLGSARNPTPRF